MKSRMIRSLLLLTTVIAVSVVAPSRGFAWTASPAVNRIISDAAGDQLSPQVASDGAGGTILVWQDSRNGNWDIYAQRLNPTGGPIWPVTAVAITTDVSHQRNPQIVSDGSGGAIITWQDDPALPDGNIYAQRINADGNALWPVGGVVVTAALGVQSNPRIAGDGSGGAIVTWQDYRGGAAANIFAQRVSQDGAMLWAANGVPVCNAVNDQRNPQIVSDGSGGAIIAWEDYRGGTSWDIYARRILASGAAAWTPNGVAIAATTVDQRFPQLVSTPAGGAAVYWIAKNGPIYKDIYVQIVNAAGAILLPPGGILFFSWFEDLTNNHLRIIADGLGGAIVAWQDRRNNSSDIYALRVDPVGTVLWTADGMTGVFVSTAVREQSYPQMVADGLGGAVIAWQDRRSGTNWDIYAQKVEANGKLPGAPDTAHLLNAAARGNGSGLIASTIGGISFAYPAAAAASATLHFGTAVTLYAQADTGSTVSWLGDCNARGGTPALASCTITNMNAAKTVTATFTLKKYALTVTKTGTGSGVVKPDTGVLTWVGKVGTGRYDYNTPVVLTPTPAVSSTFTGWTGCDSVAGNLCTVTMNMSKSVSAAFALKQYTLVANAEGNGSGAVQSSVGGIDYLYPAVATESAVLTHGTAVTLTATAGVGSTAAWSGACGSRGGTPARATCTIASMNSAKTVKATFTLKKYALTVNKTDNGVGSVVPDTGFLVWAGNVGTGRYDHGSTVTLTATPTGTSTFGGWTGNCASVSGNQCVASMLGARTVNASFILKHYTLTANADGSGSGTVVSTAGGIDYAYPAVASAAGEVNFGTEVILTATADAGSTVTWSGQCSSRGGTPTVATCTISSMLIPRTVKATFVAQ